MSWSKQYKKSIDCSNPKGFSQKAHCAGRKARQGGKNTKSKSVSEMKVSQLKEQVRTILRERSVKAIQKDYSNVIADMEKHLELYKKSKGTPEEKKHIGHLKTLTQKKKSLQKELDLAVAGLYKNAELKVDESVNEDIEPQTKKIASLTGTRADAVKQFVSANALNITKLLKFIEKGKLKDRMEFVSAIAGKPNNPIQKKIIKMFQESMNEGKFKVDDLVYNKRTKTVGIVRMGDDRYGEVKTDADGNVNVDELEKYNPIKFKHQTKAKVAPSTEKEVNTRGLFNPFKNESVNESTEPQIISQLKDIVKNKQYQNVKDPKSGKSLRVDMQTANAVLQIYNGLSNVNKDNMVKMGLPKMIDVSFKILSKYKK